MRKGGRIGPGPQDDKESRVFYRATRWTDTGVEYEADLRRVEKLVGSLAHVGANSVVTTGLKPLKEQLDEEKPLAPSERTAFCGLAPRGITWQRPGPTSNMLPRRYVDGWPSPWT